MQYLKWSRWMHDYLGSNSEHSPRRQNCSVLSSVNPAIAADICHRYDHLFHPCRHYTGPYPYPFPCLRHHISAHRPSSHHNPVSPSADSDSDSSPSSQSHTFPASHASASTLPHHTPSHTYPCAPCAPIHHSAPYTASFSPSHSPHQSPHLPCAAWSSSLCAMCLRVWRRIARNRRGSGGRRLVRLAF
jgi:hypothetical protein